MRLDLLCCPQCHGVLAERDKALHCDACALFYPVEDGIPVLISAQARKGHPIIERGT